MKYPSFLALLLAPFLSFSQDETSRFSVGFMIMPEYQSCFIGDQPYDTEMAALFGFSTGLNLEFSLTPRLSLRSGMGFGYKRYGYDQDGLIFNSDIDPQIGIISESRLETRFLFREIQVPVIVQYEITEDHFFVAAGVDVIYVFSGESEETIFYGNGLTETIYNRYDNQPNLGIMLSAGYKIHAAHNLHISIEPTFRYCMLPYPEIIAVPYNLGLKTTLNVLF